MLMSDEFIQEAMKKGEIIIENFSEECLEGASYDMRIGNEILVSNREQVLDPEKDGAVKLEPGEFALLTTHEKLKLSPMIVGNIGAKTYFTRKGLILLAGCTCDFFVTLA